MILPSCKDVSGRAARGEPLGVGGRHHLLICRWCRRFLRQLGLIEQALRGEVFPGPDAAALEKKLRERFLGA